VPDIPEVWFKHARFDHNAHTTRAIDCRTCHKDAYPSGPADLKAAYESPRKGAEKVMIEGIENCRQCHSPSPKQEYADKGQTGRFDCAECHTYHHGNPRASDQRSGRVDPREADRLEAWLRSPRRR